MEHLNQAEQLLLNESITDVCPAGWMLDPKRFVQLSQPVPAARVSAQLKPCVT